MYIQRALLPEMKYLLSLHPALALFCDTHVKIKDDPSQDHAHFGVCKTSLISRIQ